MSKRRRHVFEGIGFEAPAELLNVRDDAMRDLNWHLHLEWMRSTVRHALGTGAKRALVAAEMGVTVYRLRTFLRGGHLYEEAARPFVSWCEGRPCGRFHPEQAALAMLVADFFQNARPSVRASVTRALEAGYASHQDRPPQWLLDEVAAGAKRAGSNLNLQPEQESSK
jgi:hypothetical protein